ncbi:phage tail protein [Achromobacter ruhlandii]|uniref:phage tail protein n=1 Tax=Achromobacter ruhlandii TaxID=72557 RepID=UPI003B9C32C9
MKSKDLLEMAITSLPTPPSRSDPENFPERADAFMAALPRFATEANALQEHVNEAAATVDQDAAAAALSRDAAAESRSQAGQSAQAAETSRQVAAQKAGEAGASAQRAQQWAEKLGAPVEGDGFSAKHWAEVAAMGAGLPVYMPGSLPPQNVGPIYIAGQGNAEWDAATGRYRVHSDIPVGAVAWWPLRTSIPAGQIPADGQTVSRATFPDLAAMVAAGTLPVVSEADWQADPLKRGNYSLGDGSTTIRLPDLNGKSAGTLGRVFLSGDGVNSAATAGLIQRDALQGHRHGPIRIVGQGVTTGGVTFNNVTGAGAFTGADLVGEPSADGINGTPRIAAETRPQNVAGAWTIQAFGAVTNPGSVDAAQLASDYAALNAAFQALRSQVFGVDQTLQDVTASRVFGVTYTNTTGRPIVLYVSTSGTTATSGLMGRINGLDAAFITRDGTAGALALSMIVPAGATYLVQNISSITGAIWREYR